MAYSEGTPRIAFSRTKGSADLGRAGLIEEIGPVITSLVSQRNSYMTGANVNVDGGSDFT